MIFSKREKSNAENAIANKFQAHAEKQSAEMERLDDALSELSDIVDFLEEDIDKPAQTENKSPLVRINEAKELLDAGLVSEEEFNQIKSRIISEI